MFRHVGQRFASDLEELEFDPGRNHAFLSFGRHINRHTGIPAPLVGYGHQPAGQWVGVIKIIAIQVVPNSQIGSFHHATNLGYVPLGDGGAAPGDSLFRQLHL